MDIGEFGATYAFIRDRIQSSGGGRGALAKAIREAAEHFHRDAKTVERRYRRLEALEALEVEALAVSEIRRQMALIETAFLPEELKEFGIERTEKEELTGSISAAFVYRLALERLELRELREKRSKRK